MFVQKGHSHRDQELEGDSQFQNDVASLTPDKKRSYKHFRRSEHDDDDDDDDDDDESPRA